MSLQLIKQKRFIDFKRDFNKIKRLTFKDFFREENRIYTHFTAKDHDL